MMLYGGSNALIVVFGGGGYIGAHLVRQLLDAGYRVRVFDSFIFGSDGIRNLDSSNLQVVIGDICDIRTVSKAVMGADAVILLSALVGHRSRESKETTLREVNFLASSVVLDAAIEHGVYRFIFASSDSVYGVQKGVLYETSHPEPVSFYSRLKLRMEERVLNSRRSDFIPTVLRICNCHGYSPRMRFDLVANTLVRDAIVQKQLVLTGPDEERAFISVKDAARSFISCLEAHERLVSGEIFNVANSDQQLSVRKISGLLQQIKPDLNVQFRRSAAVLDDYSVSSSKLEKSLNFKCEISFLDSLKELWQVMEEGVFADAYNPCYYNTAGSLNTKE